MAEDHGMHPLFFIDSVWTLAGRSNSGHNDIWAIEDGRQWERVNCPAPLGGSPSIRF